ncbi:MAG: hypothetical protein AAB608_02900 [Patescibacteria group bacterium]
MEPFLYPIVTPYFAKRLSEDAHSRDAFIVAFGDLPETIKTALTAPETAEKLVAFGDQHDLEYDVVEEIAFVMRETAVHTLPQEQVAALLARRGIPSATIQPGIELIFSLLGVSKKPSAPATNNIVDLRDRSGV